MSLTPFDPEQDDVLEIHCDRGNPEEAIVTGASGEEVENAYREASIAFYDFFRKCMMEMLSTKRQTLELECMCLALGWVDLLPGIKTAVDLAKKWQCTKANVVKIVNRMQSHLDLPPMIGQRSKEARECFRTIRKSQLTPKVEHHKE